ncbi:MAG: methyltransferase domain-containing protein [Rhodospirillaceae bacterium]|nr:methyltransferase domain-containing protein [Rhodospirillaceae bacterium]MBT6118465.1 methyltransferase domain-containing protein [Rhodospirillaceae bacterium]
MAGNESAAAPGSARREQHWDPGRYQRNAGFVAALGAPLLDLLKPRAGEDILDLGCGDGALTIRLIELGAKVVPVDASAEQVAAARARGLDARVMDGQKLTFEAAFDGVLSNAALHWMPDADGVIAGVGRALRPGGRFVAEMGGHGNVGRVVAVLTAALARRGIDAAPLNPWYFPDEAEYRERLERAGFTVDSMALIPRPTPLPGDVRAWLETFGESFLSAVPPESMGALLDEVAEALRPDLLGEDGVWRVDYVRLRFHARKPA